MAPNREERKQGVFHIVGEYRERDASGDIVSVRTIVTAGSTGDRLLELRSA